MKKKQLVRILLIDRDHVEADWYAHALRNRHFALRSYLAKDALSLEGFLNEQICELIIYISPAKDFTLEKTIQIIARARQDIPLIVICQGDNKKSLMDAYNAAIQAGATEVVEKRNTIQLMHNVFKEIKWLNDRRALKTSRLTLRVSEEQCRQLSDSSTLPIAYLQHERFFYANQAYLFLFKIKDANELESMNIYNLVADDDKTAFKEFMESLVEHLFEPTELEIKFINTNGEVFSSLAEFSPISYHSEDFIQILINTDEQKNIILQKNIEHINKTSRTENDKTVKEIASEQATHRPVETNTKKTAIEEHEQRDPITGLHTGDYFYKVLDKAIESAIKQHIKSTLLCIQHDNLDDINNEHGALKSKNVLINAASLLSLSISPEDLAARLAEDIYGVLLKNKDLNSAINIADKIVANQQNNPAIIDGKKVDAPISIGIVPVTGSQATHQEVIADAFSACRKAKRSSDEKVKVYNAKTSEPTHLAGTLHLSKEILQAINKNLFQLVYQPIANLKDHQGEFYEVFIRMENSQGDIVPLEALFIEAAEHKLVTIIDEWVIANALKVLGEHNKAGKQTHFFINIATETLKDKNILTVIEKYIKQNNLPADRLVFEISERAVSSQTSSALAFIKGLKQLGCKTTIKHVGSGLRSLKTADLVPADYIKIDTSVIINLQKDKESLGALRAITKTAHEAGKLTIADCLEERSDLFVLFDNDVDFAQGTYIQEPGTEMDFDFSRILKEDYQDTPD